MTTKHLIAFIKFTDYPEDVLAGNLHMGSVKSFIEKYKGEEGQRNDPKEFMGQRHQASKTIIKIQVGENTIYEGSATIESRRSVEHCSYLFCMTAITQEFIDRQNGRLFEAMHAPNLGKKAVILSPEVFMEKIKYSEKIRSREFSTHPDSKKIADLVEYIDYENYHGDLGPFKKSSKYNWQNEFRLAITDYKNLDKHPECIKLDVGELSGNIIDTSDLIDTITSYEKNINTLNIKK